jgi:proteasome lid subunit RPN8/RPN11
MSRPNGGMIPFGRTARDFASAIIGRAMADRRLILTEGIVRELEAHASQSRPQEACGFLAGRGDRVVRSLPVANLSTVVSLFTMDPAGQVRAHYAALAAGLDVIAVYHSHPFGPPRLSGTDIRRWTYGDVVQLILGRHGPSWDLAAYARGETGPEVIEIFIEGRP